MRPSTSRFSAKLNSNFSSRQFLTCEPAAQASCSRRQGAPVHASNVNVDDLYARMRSTSRLAPYVRLKCVLCSFALCLCCCCRYFCVEATKLLKVEAGENVSNEGFLSSVLPDLAIGTNLANF